MKYEIVKMPERLAAGISARTDNHAADVGKVISGLWDRFYRCGFYKGIPNKADGKTIGLYTEYAGGVDDPYTVMVCCAVTGEEIPGCELCRIPAGLYAKCIVACSMDKAAEKVAEAWQEIWKTKLPRAYICDYEEYQNTGREETEIHIYIGLKGDANVEI